MSETQQIVPAANINDTTAPVVNTIGTALEPMSEINARILATFNVLRKVANGVIQGYIPAAIVSGAAGCGKTHTLEQALEAAAQKDLISWESVKGSMSAIGLYRKLYESSEPGNVLVLDDCDTIFADIEPLNILKAALDTSKVRKVHWNKASRYLEEEGIPNSFEFQGTVVFITNTDFSTEIERESKMAPHYKALLSRCMYVDLGIHNKREIFVRIGQVVFSAQFLQENGLALTDAQAMMKWLSSHLDRVRVLSIRTVMQLVSLMKTDNGNWEQMANTIMLKKR